MSEILIGDYREGDRAEVTFPDGSKQIYVLREEWALEAAENHVILPSEEMESKKALTVKGLNDTVERVMLLGSVLREKLIKTGLLKEEGEE